MQVTNARLENENDQLKIRISKLLDKKLPKISNEISTEMSNFDITDMLKDEIKDYKREVLRLKDTIKDSDLR